MDATAGASGDMILGALVDLGVPLSHLRKAFEGLRLEGWRLSSRTVERGGLKARKIDVRVREDGPGRSWSEIRAILEKGRLDRPVRDRALAIFRRLVEAEAEAHGRPVARVHLHEAGAIDAIIDVVGAAAGVERLAPERIVVSTMTTGHGRVACRHGAYPVPGPATSLLVRGAPVTGGDAEGERLTPTGAAILTTIADEWGSLPPMRPERIGAGAGDRDFPDRPNLLRMILGTPLRSGAGPGGDDEVHVAVLEVTLDDAPPQVVAYAAERLFAAGALEVYTTPVHMKKGRSGVLVTALARERDIEPLSRILLSETTTLGLRIRHEYRIELERRIQPVATPYGRIRVKVGLLDGHPVQAWPEYEDCAAAARRRGVPLKRVQQAALETYHGARGAPASRKESR